jgi:hypothetical protein
VTGVPVTGVPVTGESVPVISRDELAARRHRTRTRWLQVAAAVVGVAVVGTGGYLAGARGGSTTASHETSSGGALPAISLEGAGNSGAGEIAPAPATDKVAGSTTSFAARGMAMLPGGWYGRTVFSGEGLSTDGGSATAWAFDATQAASAQKAAELAAALGVAGEPRVEWGSWVVGPNDGTGATVSVSGDGMANFSYYDPTRDPYLCGTAGGASSPGSAGSAEPAQPADAAVATPVPELSIPAQPDPADSSVCQAGSTPTGDAAQAKAREVLASLGIDTSAAHPDASVATSTQVQVDDSNAKAADSSGAPYVYVTFQQVIDGRLTGVQWWVSLVGDGVQSVSGPLAPVFQLGQYDIISPAQAVDRLNDPRFGTSGGVIAYAAADSAAAEKQKLAESAVATAAPSDAPPTVPPAPSAGAAISWPVQQVTLTSAQLGLAQVTLSTGAQALVPAYQLSAADGSTWSVVAVVDAQLDFTAQQ